MKKNWSILIVAVIAAVIMYLVTNFMMNVLIEVTKASSTSSTVMNQFVDVYMILTYVFCALNILFGLWGVYKKGGCTALKAFAIFLLIFGGVVIYLIPVIMDLVAASKAKNRFVKYEAEQAALAKVQAEQAASAPVESEQAN